MKKIAGFLSFLNNKTFISFEESVLKMFKSFPKLPAGIVNFIVSFGPFLALLGGVLGILSVLSLFSLKTMFYYPLSPLATPYFRYIYLSIIGSVLSGIMLLCAFDGLRKKEIFGWRLVFWAGNVGILVSLLSLNLFGAIIGALISWYFLAQLKPKYK